MTWGVAPGLRDSEKAVGPIRKGLAAWDTSTEVISDGGGWWDGTVLCLLRSGSGLEDWGFRLSGWPVAGGAGAAVVFGEDGRVGYAAGDEFSADDGRIYRMDPARSLGRGGSGEVFCGCDVAAGTAVAVKVLRGHDSRSGRREAAVARLLVGSSRLVVPLASFVDGGDLLVVSPLAETSLRDVLQGAGVAEADRVALLADVCMALMDLAAGSVVHRDVSPGNVLRMGGRWCLADFGISRDTSGPTGSTTFTNAGTSPYLAPERWRMEPATVASDLYALGCVAYEVCAGQPPFQGSGDQVRRSHLEAVPPTAPAGAALARWIRRLMEKDPGARPQDARAALESLPAEGGSPDGPLARAALRLSEATAARAAIESERLETDERSGRLRATAHADLVDVFERAAEEARRQVPQVEHQDRGAHQLLAFDDVRLRVWEWPARDPAGGLPLMGAQEQWMGRHGLAATWVYGQGADDRWVWSAWEFSRDPQDDGADYAASSHGEAHGLPEREFVESGALIGSAIAGTLGVTRAMVTVRWLVDRLAQAAAAAAS